MNLLFVDRVKLLIKALQEQNKLSKNNLYRVHTENISTVICQTKLKKKLRNAHI